MYFSRAELQENWRLEVFRRHGHVAGQFLYLWRWGSGSRSILQLIPPCVPLCPFRSNGYGKTGTDATRKSM